MDATAARPLDPLAIPDDHLAAPRRASPVARSAARLAAEPAADAPIGRVNTPAHLARWMAAEAVHALRETTGRSPRDWTILEPAAGSGVIIAALAERLGTFDPIWAIDADAAARQLARQRMGSMKSWAAPILRRYRIGDALLDDKLLPPRPVDLLIGNPPYLGVRHARRLPQYDRWRARFGATEDLYTYFMRRAMHIVRPGGFVMLLVPDTWLTLSSYERLRREVLAGRLHFVLRLPPDTFDRQVFPGVFLWQRAEPRDHHVRYLDARPPNSLERPRELAIDQAAYQNAPGGNIFEPTATARKMARVLVRADAAHAVAVGWAPPTVRDRGIDPNGNEIRWAVHTPRGAELDGIAAEGRRFPVFPGRRGRAGSGRPGERPLRPPSRAAGSAALVHLCDVAAIGDVGIHSRNCRHRLFFARREKPGLQRLLQGRQIEPYAVRWDSPSARYRWVDIHYRPDPRRPGRRGDGSPSVRGEYWSWQGDPAIFRLPERILIRQTGDRIVAARLGQKRMHYYTDNTLFTAVLTDAARAAGITYRYLLGYLNSAIVSQMYRFLSGEAGRPQAQVKVGLLRRLPFVLPSPADIGRVDGWVRQIERRAAGGVTNVRLQSALDRHFARLIEHATRRSR